MKRWNFEQDPAGRNVIQHNALPRFRAHWFFLGPLFPLRIGFGFAP
jgi:hypothetical protein